MRAKLLLLGTTSAIFCVSAAFAHQQQDKLAEDQFKNIQVFKGQKARDIIPAMEFISASLKVGCDYCHAEDRSSDAKPEKQTARKMILMTRQINEANFNGHTEVTCATCHGGKPNPLSLPPVTGVTVRLRQDKTLSPEKVLANYDVAAGGPAAANLKGLRFEGEAEEAGHKSKLTVERWGSKFVMTQGDADHPDQATTFGFNGDDMWFARGKNVNIIPASVRRQFEHEMAMYCGRASLPQLTNMQAGTAKIDGKDVVGVRGTADDNVRAMLFFDKDSHLLVRAEFLSPTILGSIPIICDYSDFHKVGGVEIATRVLIHSGDGDEDNRMSVRADDKVRATDFDPPK